MATKNFQNYLMKMMIKIIIIISLLIYGNVGLLNTCMPDIHDPVMAMLQHAVQSKPTVYNLTGTMYNAVIEQCDADPLITAGMYTINYNNASEHRWIALSRDLLKRWGGKFWYGDVVIISNARHKDGIYTIVDTMNKRFNNRIDFLETTGTKRYKFTNITMEKSEV
jgi:3D (Asp-Asp-Asp) domain-containing protein